MDKKIKFLIIPDIERLDESIALAEEYDLGFETDDFFHPSVLDDEKRRDEIIGRLMSSKMPDTITVHGDFFDVLVFSEDRKIREISELRVIQSMDVAVRLGAKGVVFHTNHAPTFRSPAYIKKWLELNTKFWERILPEYKDTEIYIENMFDVSPDMLVRLAEAMKGKERFGVCFDYAHACTFGSGCPIDEWCSALAPYIKHMHINDNDLIDDLHLAVGDGKIDWEHFASLLGSVLMPDTVLIEIADVEKQRRSLEFLAGLGLVSRK